MKRKILLIPLALLLALSLIATGCPAPVDEDEVEVIDPYEEYVARLQEGEFPVPREAFEQAVEEGELVIYDWAGWWPEEIFEGFSEEFGIKIIRDHFASMDGVRAKFSLYPDAPYDLVISQGVQDFFLLKEIGALQQMNHDWIPNVREYTKEELLEMDYDPDLKYSVITDWTFLNYVYNTKFVDDPRLPSWAVLFDPMEELKGKILLWDDMHETIGGALKYLGYDFFSDDEAELMEARDLLLELKPHILAFDSSPSLLLYADEAWISGLYYGDGWFMNAEYEAIVPALPAEGSMLGLDLTLHPIASPHPAAAHLFLNYLFRPQVMALYIETIWYTPTHTAVLELLPADFQEKVAVPEGYLDKSDLFDPRAVTGRGLELRTEIWEELRM